MVFKRMLHSNYNRKPFSGRTFSCIGERFGKYFGDVAEKYGQPVYRHLFDLVWDRDYFVLTMDVDHCFKKRDLIMLFFTRQKLY